MSIREIIGAVASIKEASNELSVMSAAAGQALLGCAGQISSFSQGSKSGEDAVKAVNIAAASIRDAAAQMKMLGSICDECMSSLSR